MINNSKLRVQSSKFRFKSHLLIFLLGLLLSLFIFNFKFLTALAQTSPGLDLTISPPVMEFNVKPGDKIKEKFRIRNNLTSPIGLEINVNKLSSDSVSGEAVPAEPTSSDEFISWLSLASSKFSVPSKEWKEVSFSIDVPITAAYGYYYVLRVAPTGDPTINGSGAKVKGEVLVVILLNVKKEGAIAKGKLFEFKPNNFISEYLPVDFSVKVKNEGNVHMKPRGNVFIRSFHQNDVAILDVNSTLSSVLPNGTKTYTTSWSDGFIVRVPVVENDKPKLDVNDNPVTKIQINWDKLTHFRVGKYTATILMVYDDGKRDQTMESTTTFWLIPYTALAVITISLIVFVVIVRFLLKWYIRRELKRLT